VRPRRPAATIGVTLIAVAAVGVGIVAARVWLEPDASTAANTARLSTATVRRSTLVDSRLISGTLGYRALPPLANQLPGIYTWLPRPGATIAPGHVLYRVDNTPVVLLRGATPAWRAIGPGVTAGPDVAQLNRDLAGMGYGAGLVGPSGDTYSLATQIAIERWQQALGVPVTGALALGAVVFRPAPVRVGPVRASIGAGAAPGQQPYQVTAPRRVVVASIPSDDASEAPRGATVSIQVPGGQAFRGRITALAPSVATAGSGPAISITITPVHTPPARGVEQEPVEVGLATAVAHNVLAAPITALVALQRGGYGVEVVTPSGSHRLLRVHPGIFASGLVELHGAGIGVGTRVVVSQ
jgi:hypothetical protein